MTREKKYTTRMQKTSEKAKILMLFFGTIPPASIYTGIRAINFQLRKLLLAFLEKH
jgi:hypothetical protein